MPGCCHPWIFLVRGQVQHAVGTWKEGFEGEKEKEGENMESQEQGNWEQNPPVGCLWLWASSSTPWAWHQNSERACYTQHDCEGPLANVFRRERETVRHTLSAVV